MLELMGFEIAMISVGSSPAREFVARALPNCPPVRQSWVPGGFRSLPVTQADNRTEVTAGCQIG
jgi:hypothetical protein